MKDRRGTKQRGLDMFFKRRKRDQKEAPIEGKDTKEELKEVPKEETKEESKEEPEEGPKEEPKEVAEEKVMKTPEEPEEEIKPSTADAMLREFLRTREAPFTIRMLTRETGLTLNDAKAVIQTLLSTEEMATHTVGKTPVYCKTGRFMTAILSQVMPEGVPAFVQEESRRLMEKVTALEQENTTLSKKYEELQSQYTAMESKMAEPAEEPISHLQERVSTLEQDNKRLVQENQDLNAQIISFQTQLEKITALEQENKALSKKYEELQSQYTAMESKAVEPAEELDSQRQERITALEEEHKKLIQENQKLNAQIVSFQTQFGGKETEWKTVAMLMAEEMAIRANTSTEDVLRHFEAPGYY